MHSFNDKRENSWTRKHNGDKLCDKYDLYDASKVFELAINGHLLLFHLPSTFFSFFYSYIFS